jgi:hypothetical protein
MFKKGKLYNLDNNKNAVNAFTQTILQWDKIVHIYIFIMMIIHAMNMFISL